MPPLMLFPFSIFFICCILQFWFLKKVRDALVERHPGTLLDLEDASVFLSQELWRFTRTNRYQALDDTELNRHVLNLRRLTLVAFIAWAAFAITLFTAPLDPPRLPLDVANGSYANSCCGTLVLKDGHMTVSNRRVGYVVESDKVGRYVLPSLYVGSSPRGFVVRDGQPLKLYLGDGAQPASIELMDDTSAQILTFRRSNPD